MAEAYANHFAGKTIAISAGTADIRGILGNHTLSNVIQVMKEDNIDISDKEPHPLDEHMLKNVKTIVVLSKKTDCPDYIIKRDNVLYHEICDPYEQTLPTTRKIRDEIKIFVQKLLHQEH